MILSVFLCEKDPEMVAHGNSCLKWLSFVSRYFKTSCVASLPFFILFKKALMGRWYGELGSFTDLKIDIIVFSIIIKNKSILKSEPVISFSKMLFWVHNSVSSDVTGIIYETNIQKVLIHQWK